MKKILIILLIIMAIISIMIVIRYKDFEKQQREVSKFNLDYEYYNRNDLNGLDITTLINKAISNNEKYTIPKDEQGLYVLDDEYSIEIYVTMVIDKPAYRMESFEKADINTFVRYFGEIGFKCTDVTYHKKTGRIASMTFEALEY